LGIKGYTLDGLIRDSTERKDTQMSADHEAPGAIEELKQFVEFLQNLWATLAGVSVLFPLSNTFAQIIPLGKWTDGGFAYLSPTLVTALTTLVCLFVVFWTFTKREQIQQRGPWETLPKQAVWLFGIGVGALIIYLGGHYAITHDFYFAVLGWESEDLRRIFGDLVLLIAYGSFFTCVTRAFVGLGLREYLRPKVKAV